MLITRENMLNYWCLELATTFVNMKEYRQYQTTSTNNGLFGNAFFKKTMELNKFLLI